MPNVDNYISRVLVLNRVLTVACGLSVAVAGCVDLAPQASVPNGADDPFRITTAKADAERDDGATVVRPNTTKGDEVFETQPNTDPIVDTISIPFGIQQDATKEPGQNSIQLFDNQADGTAHELPESLERTVQDAALAPLQHVVDDNPQRLMGLGVGELTTILGSPRFVRRDSSAQLWRYRNKSCILDLFLYRNVGQSKFFVNYIEARQAKGGAALKRKCFGALLLQKLVGEVS